MFLIELIKRIVHALSHPVEALVALYRYAAHGYRIAQYGKRVRAKIPVRTLGVMPETPWPIYTLWGVAHILGLRLVARSERTTIAFADVTTWSHGEKDWINGSCIDISKSIVARTFSQVSRRTLSVDPLQYHGYMVEKSELNAMHDGRLVYGPLRRAKHDCTYQRFIDNTTDDGCYVEDLRVTVVGRQLPIIYRKQRTIERRFESSSMRAYLCTADEVLSISEQQMCLEVAHKLGLDFGEMDVLRDRGDGEIYIVDVNKTSVSPPISLSFGERLKALQSVAAAFEKEFLGESVAL